MKNIKNALLVTTMAVALIPASVNAAQFKDMPEPNNWAYKGAKYAVEKGYMSGYEDNTLRLGNKITRSEAASILNRVNGGKKVENGELPFTDVPKGNWAYDSVLSMYKKGFIKGTSSDKFSPDKNITREEAFSIIGRMFMPDADTKIHMNINFSDMDINFSDKEEISGWARESINYLVITGVVKGNNGKINPKAYITRGEFATILNELNKEPDNEYSDNRKNTNTENNTNKQNITYKENKAEEKGINLGDYIDLEKVLGGRTNKTETNNKNNTKPSGTEYITRTNPVRIPTPGFNNNEQIVIRSETTPLNLPTVTEGAQLEVSKLIDGRDYYGIKLENVDSWIIKMVNDIREENGLSRLKVVSNWDEKAYHRAFESNMKAKDLNGTTRVEHERIDGSSINSLFNPLYEGQNMVTYQVGENLFWIRRGRAKDSREMAKYIVDTYMNSQGHRENILNPGINYINSGTSLQTNPDGSAITNGAKTDIANSIIFG